MSASRSSRWFSDEGKQLDRFGLVIALSTASVAILSLVDLNEPTASIWSAMGWLLVTVIVGLTLVVSLGASGVAARPRRVAEIVVLFAVIVVVVVTVVGIFADFGSTVRLATRPSPLWAAIAVVSPGIVLRRIMLHRVVTTQTILGVLSVYLLLALAFNYMYLSVDVVEPFFGVAESTSSFMYFSLVTITTVGYGDLTAVSDLGRFLSASEAILGQVLLVTVVARLVSLYSRDERGPLSEENMRSATP